MMKKVLGAVSALALMGAAGVALAAQEATGTIESFDEEQMMLILDTGDRFKLGEGVETEGLAEGAPVTVRYEEENGEWVATEIELAAVEMVEEAEDEAVEVIEDEEAEEAAE
jgi:opacity protein-like surface antigen